MSEKKVKAESRDPAKVAAELIATIKRKSVVISASNAPVPAKSLTAFSEAMKRNEDLAKRKHAELEGYFLKLRDITIEFSGARKIYQDALYKMLGELYTLYRKVESSEHQGSFYANLRGGLREHGVQIQSNTTDEALLIRFVLRAVKPKQVFDYSTVLAEALEAEIEADAFSTWIESTTITGAIASYRKRTSNHATYKDRLTRARLLILRMLDIRETRPIGSFSYPTPIAEKWVHAGTRMVVLLGYATRKFDRGSGTADINILFHLSPNMSTDVWVINEMAKQIVSQLEIYEEKMNTMEQDAWADQLYEQLVANEAEHAEERAEWWMDRQLASRYEDQHEFMRERARTKRKRAQRLE